MSYHSASAKHKMDNAAGYRKMAGFHKANILLSQIHFFLFPFLHTLLKLSGAISTDTIQGNFSDRANTCRPKGAGTFLRSSLSKYLLMVTSMTI